MGPAVAERRRCFSLVLPLYDEDASVEPVASELMQALDSVGEPFELILVDNGSRDRTGEIVARLCRQDARIVPVRVAVNRGFGGGVLAGLAAASGDLVGFMGGDGQVAPADLLLVLRAARERKLDLAKGRRTRRADGWRRRVVSLVYNGLFRVVFLSRVGDVNGSPKILSRAFLESLALRSEDWFLDAEIVLKSKVLKARVGDVPLSFGRRRGGGSHVRFSAIAEFLRNMVRYRMTPKSAWFGAKG